MESIVFKIYGGGDYSVGIPDVDAMISITENIIEFNEEDIERWKENLAEFYDIPKSCVMTLEECNEQLRLE